MASDHQAGEMREAGSGATRFVARRRFRFSLRSMMLLIAVLALLLAPAYWAQRELIRSQHMAERMRSEALQAQYAAMVAQAKTAAQSAGRLTPATAASSKASPSSAEQKELERLKLENQKLRQRIEELEKGLKRPADSPAGRSGIQPEMKTRSRKVTSRDRAVPSRSLVIGMNGSDQRSTGDNTRRTACTAVSGRLDRSVRAPSASSVA